MDQPGIDDDDDDMGILDALIAEAEADLTTLPPKQAFQPSQLDERGTQPAAAARAAPAAGQNDDDGARTAKAGSAQDASAYSRQPKVAVKAEARPGFEARGGQAAVSKPKGLLKPISTDSTFERFSGLKIKCVPSSAVAAAALP